MAPGDSLVVIEGERKNGVAPANPLKDSILLTTVGNFNFTVFFENAASRTWGFMNNNSILGNQTVKLRQEAQFSGTGHTAMMFAVIPFM